MDESSSATSSDVDALWTALQRARAAGDHDAVRQIENQLRDVGTTRRFAHLSDAELDRRIRALQGNREPSGMIGHSPGGSGTEFPDTALMRFNAAHRENQVAGIEPVLQALLDERRRRTG